MFGCFSSCYIYPPQNAESYVPKDGQHETFLRVSQEVSKGLVRMASEAKASLKVSHRASSSSSSSAGGKYGLSSSISKFPPEPLLSGALALALCKINRCKEDYNNSRIAILTPSSDNAFHLSSQYMNFMNAFFTAQKMVSCTIISMTIFLMATIPISLSIHLFDAKLMIIGVS